MFSSVKVIKTDRRTSLYITTLDDLMEINVEGPSPVNLWWSDRARRPNQVPRKEYKQREAQIEPDSDDQDTVKHLQEFNLNDWDEWFAADN